jgi:Putative transposase
LSTIAADPQHLGAEIGFFAVLHSWGQNLDPHLHCVVPGAGISPDGTRWISCRPRFFLSVRVHSRLFRRLFLTYLQLAFDSGKLRFFSSLAALQDPQAFSRHLDPVRNVKWVVYVKPPFAGPQQVVDYAGRYTHRVAISNHRIVGIEDGQVKLKVAGLSRQTSSSGDSCSMFCLAGSTAFATTGSSAIATASGR